MTHSIQYEGIKLDVQTKGVEMNDYLRQKLHNTVKKLKSYLPESSSIDIYLKSVAEQAVNPRSLVIRFGIPGPDIVASDSGHRWKLMLKNVEKRLLRQLEKRKANPLKENR